MRNKLIIKVEGVFCTGQIEKDVDFNKNGERLKYPNF